MQANKGATDNFAGLYYIFSSNYWLLRGNSQNWGRFASAYWRPE